MAHKILPGTSYPLGATIYKEGINFSVFSKNAEYLELLLFEDANDSEPSEIIRLNPKTNRTFYYWHVLVEGLKAGQLYGYKVYLSKDSQNGKNADPHKLLTDPYAKAIVSPDIFSRKAAMRTGNNNGKALKSAVVSSEEYNWEGDEPLNIPYSDSIIYELHVKGFTYHESSGVTPEKRGTYAGLVEKIPYLKELGVTAVELMPVYQFDEQDAQHGLPNYWGYTPINFFAIHNGYGFEKDPIKLVSEFKDMVKAFHKAGIEIILDVVFNHTAEAGPDGPIYNFKGFGNNTYYLLKKNGDYRDYTGCGNTLNANHSIVRRMIMDSLKYWADEMHVDGFRFDLASVLSRDEYGKPLKNPPILWEIESEPGLAHCKIIAEAWDAGGLYQVGSFIGEKWAEWNGYYRDDGRRFIKGDEGIVKNLASRILGSPDIYPDPEREPNRSIHFITCHDGFTMNDLVSYDQKYNEANNERNQDGSNYNDSWNCGIEGPTDDPAIENLRQQQIKNFFTLLFVSQGTPMILMGDEVRRTQNGNNNAYCQDNEISWFDWSLVDKNKELLEFVKFLIAYTSKKEVFKLEKILTTREVVQGAHLRWHGTDTQHPDWSDFSRSLAFSLSFPKHNEYIYVILNSYWDSLTFELPKLQNGYHWQKIIDTADTKASNIIGKAGNKPLRYNIYKSAARSIVVLEGTKSGRKN